MYQTTLVEIEISLTGKTILLSSFWTVFSPVGIKSKGKSILGPYLKYF